MILYDPSKKSFMTPKIGFMTPKLGFMNPLLYKMAESSPYVFNDIKIGNNFCTESKCCPMNKNGGSDYGFLAADGWDPVTGLGTPNYGLIQRWLDNNT